MGQKFNDGEMPLDEEELKVEVSGISGGCYCCGQQMHFQFKGVEALPIAAIEDTHFYVILCEVCDQDSRYLKEKGIEAVSFDILWMIQGPLNEKLISLDGENGGFSEIDRNDLLYKLYMEFLKKVKNKIKKENAKAEKALDKSRPIKS